MFDVLDRQTRLTGNQKKIIAAAVIGDALEFFDYFLISFVLAFLIGPWKLTFGQSAIVLLSSGVGAILGAGVWGWIADRIGRRAVFIGTVLNFSIATGLLYFTPDNGWIYLTIMRFFVGFGVGGLYCVDLPLVQEFMPTSKRGWVGGLVTCVIPLGVGLGAVLGAFIGASDWRLLFAIGVLPSVMILLVRLWVPESPRWLARQGRLEEARESLAWALEVPASSLTLPRPEENRVIRTNWFDLFKYPRSLLVSWLGNAGAQTGVYGITLWAPSLFVLMLKVTPQEAAKMMILLSVTGFLGRLSFSYFSEKIGRRNAGGLMGFAAGIADLSGGVFQILRPPPGQDGDGAFGSQRDGSSLPDAGARAGDPGDLARELSCQSRFPFQTWRIQRFCRPLGKSRANMLRLRTLQHRANHARLHCFRHDLRWLREGDHPRGAGGGPGSRDHRRPYKQAGSHRQRCPLPGPGRSHRRGWFHRSGGLSRYLQGKRSDRNMNSPSVAGSA